jgi:hypothetical protein
VKEQEAKRTQDKNAGQADKFGHAVGEKKTVNGATYKYIGNDQWQKL